jgi:hypothetical protein
MSRTEIVILSYHDHNNTYVTNIISVLSSEMEQDTSNIMEHGAAPPRQRLSNSAR